MKEFIIPNTSKCYLKQLKSKFKNSSILSLHCHSKTLSVSDSLIVSRQLYRIYSGQVKHVIFSDKMEKRNTLSI